MARPILNSRLVCFYFDWLQESRRVSLKCNLLLPHFIFPFSFFLSPFIFHFISLPLPLSIFIFFLCLYLALSFISLFLCCFFPLFVPTSLDLFSLCFYLPFSFLQSPAPKIYLFFFKLSGHFFGVARFIKLC